MSPDRRRRAGWRAGALALLVAALAGCGSSVAAHLPTTTKPQPLAERYTAVVSSGDHELQRLTTQLNSANGNVLVIQQGFRSVAATYLGVAKTVRGLPFPASMRADVAAMVSALTSLAADATQGSQSVDVTQFNGVFTKLAAEQKTEVTANTTVNHDLGISAIH
ncbi:MAG: hypothetical protein ACYDES_14390 [Acidimicrobiales bacterium]